MNSRFFYKPEEIESMEDWREIIVDLKKILENNNTLIDFSLTWAEWKGRLEDVFKTKINDSELPKDRKLSSIRPGNKFRRVKQILYLDENSKSDISIQTIHGCKGMSLDAVLFLSTFQLSKDEDSGGYWKQ